MAPARRRRPARARRRPGRSTMDGRGPPSRTAPRRCSGTGRGLEPPAPTVSRRGWAIWHCGNPGFFCESVPRENLRGPQRTPPGWATTWATFRPLLGAHTLGIGPAHHLRGPERLEFGLGRGRSRDIGGARPHQGDTRPGHPRSPRSALPRGTSSSRHMIHYRTVGQSRRD